MYQPTLTLKWRKIVGWLQKGHHMELGMANILKFVFLFCGSALGARSNIFSSNGRDEKAALAPDAANGTCKTLIEIQGYVCEEHTVTTQDGYILSMQRILVGRSGETSGNRLPVFLQHGALVDGAIWLMNSPDQSLPFILADSGFDVWLANSRGTRFSRRHTSLSTDDPAYWDWTWEQLAAFDLPATVQYVHDQTGQKLYYVGQSVGTLIALAALSRGKLLEKLRSVALLSPIAYMGHTTSFARYYAETFEAETAYQEGYYEFDPAGGNATEAFKIICKKTDCYKFLSIFTGKNCCLNASTIDLFLDHEPHSTAIKNLIHLSQMIRGGNITMYDYGDDNKNKKHYGQPTPPVYNMTSIPNDLPLFISHGGQDALSVVKDVKALLDDLKDHDGDKLVVQFQEDYAHADFIMGVNAKQMVYDPLIAFFRLQ